MPVRAAYSSELSLVHSPALTSVVDHLVAFRGSFSALEILYSAAKRVVLVVVAIALVVTLAASSYFVAPRA